MIEESSMVRESVVIVWFFLFGLDFLRFIFGSYLSDSML